MGRQIDATETRGALKPSYVVLKKTEYDRLVCLYVWDEYFSHLYSSYEITRTVYHVTRDLSLEP